MSSDNQPVTIQILDKEYRIACPAGQENALRESAIYLNSQINEIRKSGKAIGPDRVTVMAALNIAHECLSQRNEQEEYSNQINKKVRSLHERIESVIRSTQQLEL